MSHSHYIPKRAGLSMAELNQSKKQVLRLAQHLTTLYHETGDERYSAAAARSASCSTYWQGFYCPICGTYHNMHTTGCKHRLCPICAVRASRVVARQATEAVDFMLSDSPDLQCSLLTLTQRNVEGDRLSDEVDSMLAAWQALRHLRAFSRNVAGWARTIEIIPAKDKVTYHPHIHAILVHRGLNEISGGAWWARAWANSMKLDYFPIVDIRPIEDMQGAVYEVSKYVSKLSRVYDGTSRELDHVRYIGNAMYQRQLRTYGGEWLKARRALNMARVEQMDDDAIAEYGDMLNTEGTCDRCSTQLRAVCLSWAGLSYVVDGDFPVQNVQVGGLINA